MKAILMFLLLLVLPINPQKVEKAVDEASLGQVIRRTKEMYESGVDKRSIAEWVTKVVDNRLFSSNKAEAITRPIWASMQVRWLRENAANTGEYYDIANTAWSWEYGNCEENSAVVYYILKKAGVKENVRVLRTKGHSFCVWDMPPTAQTNDPSTWGDALIVDPWYGAVLDGPEAADNFWFQNGKPKEVPIRDATKDIDVNADSWKLIQKREEHRTGQKITNKNPEDLEDCFIATAVYGTPLNEEIQILRDFRDNKLRKHFAGRLFISTYERLGPVAAYYIKQKESRKDWARQNLVEPVLYFAKKNRK